MFTCNFEKQRAFRHISLRADYVIAGGGMTGVCSAITAARAGVKVILVQDRPVLGGNASSEVRLWVLGATSHMGNNNRWSREGGVLDEILVENTFRNKEGNPVLFDMVLMDKVLAEPNITLLLNTVVYKVEKNDTRTISRLTAINPQNGTEYTIEGDLFADCTGDGTLGYLAGASFRMGAEEKEEYGEGFAPDKQEYGELLGHSILFYMKDTGRPVKYTAPDFAIKDAERHIPKLQNPNYFNPAQHGCKYWWLEYGGRLDTVTDTERIKFELWRVVYGVWDYIKNSGKFPQAENLTLEWAGLFPGKRESRRFTGLYTITQQDIIEQHTHYDAVAYGGWSIDLPPSDGVFSPKNGCNQWHSKGVYQIPYRCYVTPDLDNLFIGGRIMSSSHVANGSTRVMCTAALGGQAIGMAAALCLEEGCKPADYAAPEKIVRLQSELVKLGQFIPGLDISDGRNLLDKASLRVSSELQLDELPHDGTWFRLEYPAAQLLPVNGRMPRIEIVAEADDATELRIELRSSLRRENYTPDRTDAVKVVQLVQGENRITLDFGIEYETPRYVFVCFMANDKVRLPQSGRFVTGLTSVFNHINPAVSNFGRQTPPEGIGVDAFEFWCPKRRPEGKNFALRFTPGLAAFGAEQLRNSYFRPYLAPNGWAAAANDFAPELEIAWNEPQTFSQVRLFFDTDADHAMENVQMGHYDSVMPCCIRDYILSDDAGRELAHVEGNHQTVNTLTFQEPITAQRIRLRLMRPEGDVCPALMGIVIESKTTK